MYRIKTMNKIASAGLDQLDKSRFQVGEDVENEDGILVRSAKMHDYVFPDALRAIARAGAGTNNIPIRVRHRGLQYPRRQRQRSKGAGHRRPAHRLPGHRRGRGLGPGTGSYSKCGCSRRRGERQIRLCGP